MDTKKGLIASDINDTLFSEIASNIGLELISWKPVAIGDGQSGSGKLLTAGHELDTRIEGHFAFDITGNELNGVSNSNVVVTKQVLLRAKSAGEKLISMFSELAGKSSKKEGTELARALAFFQHSNIRDVQLAKAAMQDPILQALMPSIYYATYDNEQDKSFFVMERFDTAICSHIDCIEGGSSFGKDSWTTEAINHVLAGIATVHAKFLDNITALPEPVRRVLLDGINITTSSSAEFMKIETSLLKLREPALLSDFAKETIDKIADNASYIEHTLHGYPKTLVHNDFNNRNCCLRRHPSKGQTYLCAYDWELATLHVPQFDVAHFLSFVVPLQGAVEAIQFHSKFYHECLLKELRGFQSASKTIKRVANEKEFHRIFDMCMMIFLAARIMLFHATEYHTKLSFPYIDRVTQVAIAYLKAVAKQYDFLQ